jgi:ATP-dependent Zn protease
MYDYSKMNAQELITFVDRSDPVVKALVIKLEVYADFAEKMAAAIQTELDEFDNNNGV